MSGKKVTVAIGLITTNTNWSSSTITIADGVADARRTAVLQVRDPWDLGQIRRCCDEIEAYWKRALEGL